VGRLLITLYLVSKGLIEHPCLYLSAHLEKNRSDYYDALTHVRNTNDLRHWIRFFLVAIIETSKTATTTFRKILEVRAATTEKVATFGRSSHNAAKIVDYLYAKPIVSSQELSKKLELSQSTTNRLVALLQQQGILHELTGQQRNRVFCFQDYYRLFAH
jgi:Fic family protein